MSFNIDKYSSVVSNYHTLINQHKEITDYIERLDNPVESERYRNQLLGEDLAISVSSPYSSNGQTVRLIEDLGMQEANKMIRSILRTALIERKLAIEEELKKQFSDLADEDDDK